MNLRCVTNLPFKLILVLLVFSLFAACGDQSGDKTSQTNDQLPVASSSDDDHHDDEHHHDGDHHDGDGPNGPGPDPGTSGVNVIAVHNPKSPQYNDNCLSCHAGIPDSESLDPAIPNAHVAMLGFTPGIGSDQCIWCHRDVSNNLIHTAAQVGAFQANIRKTVDSQLCAICHGPVGPGKPFYQSGLTTAADLNGAELYRHLCSTCHRQLSDSEVQGESVEEIYGAIAENEGGMEPLSVLNPAWVQAIAAALGGDTTLPPDIPAPGTGDALYQQYCSNCHGPLASSAKTGATTTDIQNGIANVPEMSSLSFLTATQIQAISDALAGSGGGTGGGGTGGGGTGGTDGASLYQTYCAGCHGDLANSSKAGASATLIQNGINNVGEMSSLSFLTTTQIQAIADALSGGGGGGGGTGGGGTGGGGGTDGASLYQTYCAGCHNDLANSDQSGASATTIQNAINNVGEMSSLSSLTTTQIQAIADDLSGGGGGSGGTDGAILYQTYCSSCHGSLNESEVRNESAEEIRHAIEENEGDMGTLDSLTESQIEAIAAVLN